MSLDIAITFDTAMIAQLEKVHPLIVNEVSDKCLAAMARPVVERAKILAPCSKTTIAKDGKPNRDKMGKNVTKQFVGKAANSVDDSGKNTKFRVMKANRGAILYVGFSFPRGLKQQFNNSPNGRKVVYWGKQQGRTRPTVERVMQKAYDETKPAQLDAFNAALEKAVKELRIG